MKIGGNVPLSLRTSLNQKFRDQTAGKPQNLEPITSKKTKKKLKGGQNGSNYYYQFSGIDRPVTPQLRGSFEPIQVKPFVNPFYSLLNGGKKKTKKNKTKKNKTKKCKCKCKCPYCNCN